MKGPLNLLDVDLLVDLWQKCAPDQFMLTKEQFESHSLRAPLVDFPASIWTTLDRAVRQAKTR